jgi:hypothetical protein
MNVARPQHSRLRPCISSCKTLRRSLPAWRAGSTDQEPEKGLARSPSTCLKTVAIAVMAPKSAASSWSFLRSFRRKEPIRRPPSRLRVRNWACGRSA